MRILVVGGGAREHALSWRLAGEPGVTEVLCAPGNPGIAGMVRTLPVDPGDPGAVLALAEAERIDLTVIGPELPLSRGVADLFAARGLRLFGPTRAAAELETSKVFAKAFMVRHGVPTARYRACATAGDAFATLASGEFGYPVVLKADGLAAGKGVVVAPDRATAEAAVTAAMVDQAYGEAGAALVIEECLVGEEVSYFVVADGVAAVPLVSAQDHKRIFDDDQGPNTGGMGAFAPSPRMEAALEARVLREVVAPVLEGMQAEGRPFRGFLYCGLMLTADGPKVIEFNCRFGDPEAQVVMPLLDEPLSQLLWEAAGGTLASRPGRFRREPHVGVVLAARGYPGDVETGQVITGLDAVARECPDAVVFHAGVTARDGALVTAGGRVLTIVGRGATYPDAIACAYDAVSRVHFDGMQYRRDIGRKAL
ncbi:MAG: phosphoribosylamine--glycine ligase [Vicinamibacterales bacterium]|nr:phosphoribosylamine--glycine ligase [Vicinamibacterales bacterium]